MRILVVSDLPQFVTGGAEMQASRLIAAWVEDGHEVICLGRRMRQGTVELGGRMVKVYRISTIQWLGRLGRAASYFASLSWRVFRLREWPDVIYCRFLGDAAVTLSVGKAMGWLRVPVVPTPANAGGTGDVSYLRSVPGVRTIVRLLDRQLDAINIIAPGMEHDLREAGFHRVRLSRIPNGIPIGRDPPPVAPGDRLRFLSVGRLAEQKGYDVLIKALGMLPDRVAERIRVEIAGDGPLRGDLEAASRSLRPGVLAFLGELDRSAVLARLGESDVFLLSSRYEGMSNAALEAMERGRPLLVTRCGGIDTYLTAATGWVVEPNDAAGLARAITLALDTPATALLEMGAASRALVESEFSMPRVAKRYLDLFGSLIDANRSDRSKLQ
jgi:glycosyltransferase involved in cell wall biosynthesis